VRGKVEDDPRCGNLRVLREAQPELAALVGSIEARLLDLILAATGDLTARREGRWLHSSRDPRGEAARVAASATKAGADTVLVLGAGLGWTLEAALALPGVERVILCEADAANIAAMLTARDLRAALSDPRLSWMVGGDPGGLLLALSECGSRIVSTLGLKSLEDFDPAWYGALRTVLSRWMSKEEINANTLGRFGRLWVRNLARNARAGALHPGIEGLTGAFAGFPAVVLAAGPGLDDVLPLLGTMRESCLLVAVDTALRSLLDAGVEPDFLLVVDPQYWNWRHIADLSSPRSCLVTEPAVWPPVLRRHHRAFFLSESLFPLGRILAGAGRGLLGAGGSVATSAWDFARHLGCSPIYMAGLDLGYPEGRTHAKASLFEQRALASGSRLGPSATALAEALFGAPGLFVPANDGGQIRSDRRMELYAWWFEARLAQKDAPDTRTLSSRGRAIPGIPPVNLDEPCGYPRRREEVDARLVSAAASRAPADSLDRFERAMHGLLAGLRRMEAAALRGRAESARGIAALSRSRSIGRTLDVLAEVDEELRANEVRDIAGFLLPPLAELLGTATDLAANLAVSERLYGKIAASVREHLAILAAAPDTAGIGASST